MTAGYLNQRILQSATPAAREWTLQPETIYLWWLSLSGPVLPADAALLSPDEHRRAQRFVPPEVARRFRRGRAHLRRILAGYLGVLPQKLRFAYTPNGRPFVQEAPYLSFSLAHSGNVGLLAVACNRRIGVDVELPGRTDRWSAIAQRCLPPAARQRFQALPEADRAWAARRGWTRHEAFLKASGQAAMQRLLRWEMPCMAHLTEFTIEDSHGCSWLVTDVSETSVCATLVVERLSPEPPVLVAACWR